MLQVPDLIPLFSRAALKLTVEACGEIHPPGDKGFCCGGRCQVLKSWDELGLFSWSTEMSEPSK